jgi:hypothetical protein
MLLAIVWYQGMRWSPLRSAKERLVKPVLQALVLADRVYQDISGKKIIAGTFSGYKFSKKPPVTDVVRPDGTIQKVFVGGTQAGSPSAYVSITDVCDGTKIKVQFVNLSKNVTLFGSEVAISSVDRLSNVELVLPLPPLPITEAGTYAIQIVCEGEILGSWRVVAEDMDAKKGEQTDGASPS